MEKSGSATWVPAATSSGPPALREDASESAQDGALPTLQDSMGLGMVSTMQAYQRWIVRAMQDAGLKDIAVIDALILAQLGQRAHHKRLADICFILNIGDAGIVWYSLRKLIGLGVVNADKRGKEVIYSVTPEGEAYLQRFREIREQRLLEALALLPLDAPALRDLARYLRRMSGIYDEAARVAAGF